MTTAKAKPKKEEQQQAATLSGKYQAADGQKLPLFYKGSIIKIGNEPVEIDFEALGYEPKIQFLQAIKDKSIFKVGG